MTTAFKKRKAIYLFVHKKEYGGCGRENLFYIVMTSNLKLSSMIQRMEVELGERRGWIKGSRSFNSSSSSQSKIKIGSNFGKKKREIKAWESESWAD